MKLQSKYPLNYYSEHETTLTKSAFLPGFILILPSVKLKVPALVSLNGVNTLAISVPDVLKQDNETLIVCHIFNVSEFIALVISTTP